MTLSEAVAMLDGGANFGSVYPMLAEPARDGEALKAHFVFGAGGRRTAPKTLNHDLCRKCGGIVMQTGSCKTCQTCGDNEGCG